MKQLAQRPRDGRIEVVDAPAPTVRPGWVVVANQCSLISAGTERSKVELGDKSLLQKARDRPDLVRKVADRARAEGMRTAIAAAREKLDTLAPLGYSSAGIVVETGVGVHGVQPGDRVACGGGGWANHAQVVAVPRNLVAKLPAGVAFEAGAYATVGAIALHALRRADVGVGDRVGVIGLGLVGQLAVQLLQAAGATSFGIDVDPEAVALAAQQGAPALSRSDPGLEAAIGAGTDGLGLDAALICAATGSPDPLRLAAHLARDRGRIVVVGTVPIDVDREVLYEKELELRLSRSYGPGRYDRDYEEHGRDLPAGYVRWTEGRNMQAFLALVTDGRVDPTRLTTHRFGIDQAPEAYARLTGAADGPRAFGVLLEYPAYEPERQPPRKAALRASVSKSAPRIALIGAGSFARRTLVPALQAGGAELVAVASERGLSAADVAGRLGVDARSAEDVLSDETIGAVVIATGHSSHARLAAAALRMGKAVFVEKPLALTPEELADVEEAAAVGGPLMVGFNRRFARASQSLLDAFAGVEARVILARVNAGPLPPGHWAHDPRDGGGRLLGEVCHFVDLLAQLAGAAAVQAHALAIAQPERALECSDELTAQLAFANGSIGTLLYTSGGDPRLPKERIEVFGAGMAAVIDDFRRLELYRGGKREVTRQRQDKGHRAELACFVQAAAGHVQAPPLEGYLASTRATLALAQSLRTGASVRL